MTERKIRFALVGCGSITGKQHDGPWPDLGCRNRCVCDLNPDVAKAFGEAHGLPWYSDPTKWPGVNRFDLFSILTPSGYPCPADDGTGQP